MLKHEPIIKCSKPYLIYFQDMLSKNDTKMTSVSAADLRSKHFIATTTESAYTHDVITTTVPVAMRSSFAVGVRIRSPSIHLTTLFDCLSLIHCFLNNVWYHATIFCTIIPHVGVVFSLLRLQEL